MWWKDKAGQGNLNDASPDNVSGHCAAITHAHHAAVTNVCGTAARLFVTIDSASPVGLKPDMVQDHIKLEHVMFNYPSHPNVPVVKGLTILIEVGKTATLIGASGFKKRCGRSYFLCMCTGC